MQKYHLDILLRIKIPGPHIKGMIATENEASAQMLQQVFEVAAGTLVNYTSCKGNLQSIFSQLPHICILKMGTCIQRWVL
jgi:hypothetical protein